MKTLIIFMLATGAFGAPFYFVRSRNSCSKKTLRFPYGKELTYNYIGETVSSVDGSSTAQSGLKIKARCVIKAVGACKHALRIDSAELWEGQSKNLSVPIEYRLARETAVFARELQAHDLVFRSKNGAIVEVLSSYDETPLALNIKKGILSALQVQFVKDNNLVNETDITGKCPVQYRTHSKHLNGRVKVLSKTRNLEECSIRSKTYFGIHVHQKNEKPFNTLFSSSNCRYLLNTKRLVLKLVCQEKHLFRPFSSGAAAGASTTIKQMFELQPVKKVRMEFGYLYVKRLPRTSPLTFEHVKPQPKILESSKVIEIIKQLATQSIEETKPESARLFSHLIFHLRKLASAAVEKVWVAIFDCERLESCTPQEKDKFQAYLLDALTHCGTSGCALVMTRAIDRNLVNGERGNMFLTGIQMFDPVEDVIAHILRLCQTKLSLTNMLTLGTLIHKYCEDGKCKRLGYYSPIIKAETWFMNFLGKRCDFENSEQAEQIIMVLKAIDNAGRPSSESAQFILLKCAKNRNLPTNMTIAALKALRRMPCNKTIRRDIKNDLESREGNLTLEVLISGAWAADDKCSIFDGVMKDMQEKAIQSSNTSGLLAMYKFAIVIRNKGIEMVKNKFEAKLMSPMTNELRKRATLSFDEIKDLPSPLSEFLSQDPDFHKQTNWPLSDKNSSSVGLIDFVVKMTVAGDTEKAFTKSMLFLDVEATIPTILGLPLKLEAKGTAVVSATENKDPVLFFGPVTFNYLGNRKISSVVEVASRMGVDVDFAGNKGIISRNTLYTPSQSGSMEVLNTEL